MSNAPQSITVHSTPIELSALLKFAGLAQTGGEAKQVIGAGKVLVNGEVETRKGRKLQVGDTVSYNGQTLTITTG